MHGKLSNLVRSTWLQFCASVTTVTFLQPQAIDREVGNLENTLW